MPNLFNNVGFAKYTPTYERAPIEQFAKTAEILNTRWEENKNAQDQIEIALSNMKVEDVDNPVLKNRMNQVRDQFKETAKLNNYEVAGNVVKQASKEFLTDKAVAAATNNYAIRQKTKEELRNRLDKKLLSPTQYQHRIKQFNSYQGIGTPDELGFYNDYSFEFGPNRVDLQDFATQALSNSKVNTTTNASSHVNYNSPEEQAAGIGASQSSSQVTITDGTKLKFSLSDQMKNDPSVMAYITDEVNIYNEENPNKPITVDDYIEDFATDYVTKYSGIDRANSTTELRDRDEWLRSQARKKQTPDFEGWDSIPYDGNNATNAETGVLNHLNAINRANAATPSYASGIHQGAVGGAPMGGIDIPKLTPEQKATLENLKKVLGSEEAVRTYLTNTKKVGISNTYQRYTNDMSSDRTTNIKNNIASRLVFDPSTGKVYKGADFEKLINKEGAKFAVVGRPSANNTYYDQTQNTTFTRPYAVTLNGQFFMVGLSKDEQDIMGESYSIYNRLTMPYRSGRKTVVNIPETNQNYYVEYGTVGGKPSFMVYDKNNKGIGTINDISAGRNEADVVKEFKQLTSSYNGQ